MRPSHPATIITCLLMMSAASIMFGQQPGQPLNPNRAAPGPDAAFGRLLGGHPPLFFNEKWKQTEKEEHPIRQENVSNPNLELKLYGSADGGMQLTGNGEPWALSEHYVDSALGLAMRNWRPVSLPTCCRNGWVSGSAIRCAYFWSQR